MEGSPILIAGAGPVGLMTALELAYHGVPAILIDREPASTRFPKMDITNGRSMEHFRRLGFVEQVRAAGVAPEHSFDVLWALPDGGPPYAKWDLPSVAAQRRHLATRNDGSMPLEADQRIPQSAFEALARTLCRDNPLIDFREGVAFESLKQDDDGVEVVLSNAGSGARMTERVRYLVGADGAGSRVRRQLGIALDEAEQQPKTYMVHFRSTDMATIHRYGQFWHYYVTGSVLIAQDEADSWTFHTPLIGGVPDHDLDPVTMMQERLGMAPRIDEVLLTSIWQPRFALARSYRQGRVFLAGDAVHQVFPTGGYGMNTGVGDAVDLGWKLASVVNGWGGEHLLDSYDAERRPVGATNRDYAKRHLGVIIETVKMFIGGASREELKVFVETHRGENEFDGVEFGYRYGASPVIVHEDGAPPPWSETSYVASTWPGARAPSLYLADGTALYDRLGREFTLVDFAGDAASLCTSAAAREVPMAHLVVDEPAVRAAWERKYVLVRPDQHVAWRGDTLPDEAAWRHILDTVRGAA